MNLFKTDLVEIFLSSSIQSDSKLKTQDWVGGGGRGRGRRGRGGGGRGSIICFYVYLSRIFSFCYHLTSYIDKPNRLDYM